MGLEVASFINDFNVAFPDGGADPKSQGDDHIRQMKAVLKATFPGLAGRFARVQTSGGAFVAAVTDNCTIVRMTAASTFTLLAAATAGNGWTAMLYNNSAGNVTITPSGAEKVNDAATVIVPPSHFAMIFCQNTGSKEYYAVVMPLYNSIGIGADITGNIVLGATEINGSRRITATANVTLPAVALVPVGSKIQLKSVTTGSVTIVPNAAESLDGLIGAVRIPSYKSYTLQANLTDWIVLEEPDSYVGEIKPLGAGVATPKGWTLGDKSSLDRTTFAGLFAVIGVTWGNVDGTHFNAPDLQGRALISDGTGSGLTARTVGQVMGEENHALVIGELAAHNHPGSTPANPMVSVSTTGAQSGGGGGGGVTAQNTNALTIASQGSGTAHNTMQPSAVARMIVKT